MRKTLLLAAVAATFSLTSCDNGPSPEEIAEQNRLLKKANESAADEAIAYDLAEAGDDYDAVTSLFVAARKAVENKESPVIAPTLKAKWEELALQKIAETTDEKELLAIRGTGGFYSKVVLDSVNEKITHRDNSD